MVLDRHAQRYPSSWTTYGGGMETFDAKVVNYSWQNLDKKVDSGPLFILND